MDKIKRRILLLVGMIAGAVMLLNGCGETEQEEEEKTITLLASQNWIKEIDRKLFLEFEEQTGIKVELLLTPDDGYEALAGTYLAGGSSAVDIFMFPVGQMIETTGLDKIALDHSGESWVDNMEDWALKEGSCGGKLLGFNTWGIDYEGILYNKTFFKENHLEAPDTWEEFLALCDQIRRLGTAPLYESINTSWHTRSWVAGLTPLMEEEEPFFREKLNKSMDYKFEDLDCFAEGLEQIRQLLAPGENGGARYYTSNGMADDFEGSYRYLTERKAVMMFTYSAYAAELESYGSKDAWGMFPVPLLDNRTAVSNGGGMAKFINKHSQNIDESRKLFEFLAESENLEAYYSARKDLVAAAFKNVESVHTTDAAREILERTEKEPVIMFTKDVSYIDPNMYQYFQGFSDGTCSVEQFVRNCDAYREEMFGDGEKE